MEKIEYSLTKGGIGQRTTSEVDGVVVFSSKTDNFDENAIISEDQAKAHFAELQAASDRVDEKVAADAALVAAGKEKQAREAYDAALGAGLPEIVALGIARGIYAEFDPKSNNRQDSSAVRDDEVIGKGEVIARTTRGASGARARNR